MPIVFPLLQKVRKELTRTIASPPVQIDPEPGPGGGPAVGFGLIIEEGTDFLLLESGDFILQE